MILSTHCSPVAGSVQFSRILCTPPLATCSIVTTTLFPLDTRSMAPPIPFTILPYTQTSTSRFSSRGEDENITYRNDPVSEISGAADLHRPQDRQVHMPTTKDIVLAGGNRRRRKSHRAHPRIMENDSSLANSEDPGIKVTVSFPALMRSGSCIPRSG